MMSPGSFVDSSGDLSYVAATLVAEPKITGKKRLMSNRTSPRIAEKSSTTKPESKKKNTRKATVAKKQKQKEVSPPSIASHSSPIMDRIPGAHTIPGTALVTAQRKRSFGDVISENVSLSHFRDENAVTTLTPEAPTVLADHGQSVRTAAPHHGRSRSSSKSIPAISLADQFAAATAYPTAPPSTQKKEQVLISRTPKTVAKDIPRQSHGTSFSSPSPYDWGDEGVYVEEEPTTPPTKKRRRSISKREQSSKSDSEFLPSQNSDTNYSTLRKRDEFDVQSESSSEASDLIPMQVITLFNRIDMFRLIEQLLNMQKERETRKKAIEIQV